MIFLCVEILHDFSFRFFGVQSYLVTTVTSVTTVTIVTSVTTVTIVTIVTTATAVMTVTYEHEISWFEWLDDSDFWTTDITQLCNISCNKLWLRI